MTPGPRLEPRAPLPVIQRSRRGSRVDPKTRSQATFASWTARWSRWSHIGAVAGEGVPYRREPRLEPREVRIDRWPAILVRDAPLRARHPRCPAVHRRTPRFRTADRIGELGRASPHVPCEAERVAVDEQPYGVDFARGVLVCVESGVATTGAARAGASTAERREREIAVALVDRRQVVGQPCALRPDCLAPFDALVRRARRPYVEVIVVHAAGVRLAPSRSGRAG